MLGVVLLSIMVPLMVVNWAELIFEKHVVEKIVNIVMIVANAFGLFSTVVLIFNPVNIQVNNNKYVKKEQNCKSKKSITSTVGNKESNQKKFVLFEVKLIALGLFGACYAFRCGLYVWKHITTYNTLGIKYNVSTVIYIFLLFFYFMRQQETNTTDHCCKKFLKLFIILPSVGIWFDAIFSESGSLFKRNEKCNNKTTAHNGTNLKEQTFNQNNASNILEEVIEIMDPFLSPTVIEFTLMTIGLLFTKK